MRCTIPVILCNRFTGGLHFTDELITWYVPKYIHPLMANPQHQILQMYMGIDGKRLNQTEMQARGYTMTITELQIIISLPVGGPDGYYKVGLCHSGCYGSVSVRLPV